MPVGDGSLLDLHALMTH